MPLDRVGGGLIGPRRRVKPKPTATPQKPFAGAKPSTSPKPRPTRGGPVFLDPAARDRSSILSSFDQNANAIGQALMGSASYDVGRVRNRQGWQQNTLQPFAGSARSVFDREAGAAGDLGAALESAARQMGYGLQSDIGGKLSDIQAPGQAIDAAAGAQGRTGEGVAGAIHGLTGAEVGKLQSLGGAYSDFAGALPGIAGLAGDAAARDIAREASLRYAEEMAQLGPQRDAALRENERYWSERQYQEGQDAYKRGQDILAARQDALDRRDKAKSARLDALQDRADDLSDQTGYIWVVKGNRVVRTKGRTLSGQRMDLANWKADHPTARIFGSSTGGYYAIDPRTGKHKLIIAGTGPSPAHYQKGPGGTVFNPNSGTYTDAAGNPVDPGAEAPGAPGVVPDTTVAKAADWARKAFWRKGPKVDESDLPPSQRGKGGGSKRLPPMTWGNAVNYVLSHLPKDTPSWVAEAALARWYKPGKFGRPKDSAVPSGGAQGGVPDSNILPASFHVTHRTSGAEQYGAVDWFRPAGTVFGAPVGGTIYNIHGTPGSRGDGIYGYIAYLKGDNGVTYFLTHFDKVFVKDGQRVQRGTPIGTVAPYGNASHIHIGSSAL